MTSVNKKRGRIDDFFMPDSKVPKNVTSLPEFPLHSAKENGTKKHSTECMTVPGLSLHKDFITRDEEANILSFLSDPSKCTWRTDLSRRTLHFGGTYCLMPSKTNTAPIAKSQILQAFPMPEKLDWLIQRMTSTDIFRHNQRPQYCIVNEYTGALGISAHTENFQFAEPVVGLSLLSPCSIRFHELTQPYDGSVRSGKAGKAERTGRKEDVDLPGRSLLVMRGESRWRWQHEIVRSLKGRGVGWKRISLTFRYKADNKKPNDSS